MKEATGELSTTVITVIAIAAVAGLFYAFVWPAIQRSIAARTCDTLGNNYELKEGDSCNDTSNCTNATNDTDSSNSDKKFCCCKPTATS